LESQLVSRTQQPLRKEEAPLTAKPDTNDNQMYETLILLVKGFNKITVKSHGLAKSTYNMGLPIFFGMYNTICMIRNRELLPFQKIQIYINKWHNRIKTLLHSHGIATNETQYLYYLENYLREELKKNRLQDDPRKWNGKLVYWIMKNYLIAENKGNAIRGDGWSKDDDIDLQASTDETPWEYSRKQELAKLKEAERKEIVATLDNLKVPKNTRIVFERLIFDQIPVNQTLYTDKIGSKETYERWRPKILEALRPIYEKYYALRRA